MHEGTIFRDETIYLFTAYAPIAMYGPDGNVIFVIDAKASRGVLEAQNASS